MKRRPLLTALTGTSVVVGGCLTGRNGSDEPDTRDPASQHPSCGAWTSLSVEPVSPEALFETITVPRTGIGEADRTLRIPQLSEGIEQVLDGEPTTIEVERAPPLQPSPYVRRDGAVYTIDATITDTGPITGPAYRVTETSYSEIRGEQRTQSAALSTHDLWRLTEGIRSRTGAFVAGFLDPDAQEDSKLADGSDRLVVEFPDEIDLLGRYYLLERTGTASGTADRIRYSATRIGDGPEPFTTHFVTEYGISIDEPGDDVRTLLDDAIDTDGLEFCIDDDQTSAEAFYETALESLESRLEEADPMDGDRRHVFSLRPGNEYYLEYDGTWYEVEWGTSYA